MRSGCIIDLAAASSFAALGNGLQVITLKAFGSGAPIRGPGHQNVCDFIRLLTLARSHEVILIVIEIDRPWIDLAHFDFFSCDGGPR